MDEGGKREGYVKSVEGEKRKEISGTCVSGINFPHTKFYARAAVCSVIIAARRDFLFMLQDGKTSTGFLIQ